MSFDLDVRGLDAIELSVENGGDGNSGDWGVWLAPELQPLSCVCITNILDFDGWFLSCRARGGERTRPRVLFPAPPPEMFGVNR